MKTIHVLIPVFALAIQLAAATTNDLTATLKQGLYEEEANRNLEAAIAAYQQVVTRFDKDRKAAATAVYRMGECYRKLGQTNEAVAQFERVLREFSDDALLVRISQNNLIALRGSASPLDPASVSVPGGQPAAARLADAARAEQKRLYAEEIKVAEQELDMIKKQFDVGRAEQAAVLAKERDLLKLRRQASAVEMPSGRMPGIAEPALTDEEESEIRRIQALVQNSPDLINARDNDGTAPLHRAATRDQRQVVQHLLEHGADVNRPTRNGETALHRAASSGHNAVVKLLLDHKAAVEGTDGSGRTALHLVANRGFKTVAETLLTHGANLDARSQGGGTPLHEAAGAGFLDLVEFLIAKGATVDAKAMDDSTPLHAAAGAGRLAIVTFLLDRGASIDARKKSGETPLFLAVGRPFQDVVKVLLERQANPNLPGNPAAVSAQGFNSDGAASMTPVGVAARFKDVETLELLLKAGALPDAVASEEPRPLTSAIVRGSEAHARLLLEHKADPNRPLANGYPPLSLAVGSPALTRDLLAAGANPNVGDADYGTPLHRAVQHREIAVAKLLLEHGANVNARSDFNARAPGMTPLHVATTGGSAELVNLLLEYKADVNARNGLGETPLDLAKPKNLPPPGAGFPGGLPMPGASIPTRSIPQRTVQLVGAPPPPGSAGTPATSDIAALLIEHGARDDLPRFDRIVLKRPLANYSQAVFVQRTNDGSRYTLLELLAVQSGLLTPFASGMSPRTSGQVRYTGLGSVPWSVQNAFGERAPLPYPDLARIVINRPKPDGGGWTRIDVDAQAILEAEEGCQDVPLFWGDEVEVPEADHPINEPWKGFSLRALRTLKRCLTRTVQVIVKGETRSITLGPSIAITDSGTIENLLSNQSMTLHAALNESKAIRASSDPTRIKIRRREPGAGASEEWVVDASKPSAPSEAWLRDGDVIEVPDKP